VLTASAAVVSGNPSTFREWQWQRSADGVSGWSNIAGETANTYTLVDDDVDNYVRVVQTETNALGSDTASSAATGRILKAFKTTWQTTTPSETITLPLVAAGNYNFTVDWGDGNTDTITAYNQAEVTHTYATANTYDVQITGTIEGWQFNNAGDKDKITNISIWGPFVITTNGAFWGCSNLDTTATDAPTLSTTDLYATFAGCTSLTTLDASSWNVSSVTSLRSFFSGCSSLTTLDVSSWNVSNVTDFRYIFYNCSSLTTFDVSSWNVSSATSLFLTFGNCSSLTALDVTNWDVSSVTTLYSTFRDCSSLTTLDLSSWDVSSVINMDYTFSNCTSLTTLDVSTWNVSSATRLAFTFAGCSSLTALDIDLWDINQVTNFVNFALFVTIPTADYDDILIAWEAQAPLTGRSVHFGNSKYTAGGAAQAAKASLINTYGWTITDGGGIPTFISTWQTTTPSETITLPLVATGNYNFDVDWGDGSSDTITAYNQAEVTHTYATASTYDVQITGTIEGWQFNNAGDKGKITNIAAWGPLVITANAAFWGCSNLDTTATDAPIFSTTNLHATFANCSSLTTLDVSTWDVSSVTDFRSTFQSCSSLTTLDVSSWDVSSATNLSYAFANCYSLTTLDVSSWDVSSATNLRSTFQNCSSLTTLDIDLWDINQVTFFNSFAIGVSIPTADYDDILIAWEAQVPQSNMSVHFGSSQYTAGGAAEAARTNLINTYGWTITDGGGIPTFISTWQTTTPSETVTLPLIATGNYNFTVDWGDGSSDTITAYNQAEVTHTYATASTYDVKIYGTIEGLMMSKYMVR